MALPTARNLKILGLPLLTWVRTLPLSPSVPHLELTDDDIPTLPKLDFTGKFCLIKGPFDEERYDEELKTVQEANVVGFDTETLPSYTSYRFPPSLIQVATNDVCLLWRIRRRNLQGGLTIWLSSTLINILTSKNILKVGHAVSTDDAVYLLKHYHINMNNIYDTLVLANQLGLRHLSLQKLAGVFLGQNLCKKQRMSNWERNQLLDKQISYACNDAWTSLKVYEAMKRYADDNGVTPTPVIDRAWNLLKSHDQQNISKGSFVVPKVPKPDGLISYTTTGPQGSPLVYEKVVREERISIYRKPYNQMDDGEMKTTYKRDEFTRRDEDFNDRGQYTVTSPSYGRHQYSSIRPERNNTISKNENEMMNE